MNSKKQCSQKQRVAVMEKAVFSFIAEKQLISSNSVVVAAVSGGADSLALLHFLHTHRHVWGIEVVGAHLDHCLRGEASVADRKAVIDFCQKAQIPLFSVAQDVRRQAECEKDHNIEGVARAVRYDFLRQAANICHGAVIATAHHQDDQSETILMHLLRGSGMQGLCGIASKSDDVIRPFLCITKEEILAYCKEYGLIYCTDESNFDTSYFRNDIRLRVLPLLQQYNPNISQNLANLGEICARENDYLITKTKEAYRTIGAWVDGAGGSFFYEPFSRLPIALQRRVLQHFFRLFQDNGHKLKEQTLSFTHIEGIRTLAEGEQMVLPGNVLCCREEGQFIFSHMRREQATVVMGFACPLATVERKAIFSFPAWSWDVEICPADDVRLPQDKITVIHKNSVFIPAELGVNLTLRSRRAGDVFSPRGMRGYMKLKKYFINEKIPIAIREQIPLLAREEEIFWVIPQRLGNIDIITGKNREMQKTKGWYITAVPRQKEKTYMI